MKICKECLKQNEDNEEICCECGAVLPAVKPDEDELTNQEQDREVGEGTPEEGTPEEEASSDNVVNDEAKPLDDTTLVDEQAIIVEGIEETLVENNEILVKEEVSENSEIINVITDDLEESKLYINKLSSRLLLIGAIVVAILIVIMIVSQVIVRANPVYRTYNGIKKFYDKDEYNLALSIQTDVDSTIDEVTEEILARLVINYNVKNAETLIAFTTEFQKDEIIDFVVVNKNDMLYVDIPQVLDQDEYLYYEIDEYMDEEDMDLLTKYQAMIDFSKLDMKPYTDAVYDAIEDSMDSDFGSVSYDIDGWMLLELGEAILDVTEDDEELMVWVRETSVEILSTMIEDDFELYEMDKDDWDEALDFIEDRDFEEGWEDALDEISSSFSDAKDELEWDEENGNDTFEMILTYNFDLFNNIDSVVFEFESEYGEGFTLTVDYDAKYKNARKYDTDNGQDVEDLDEDDYSDLSEDIRDYIADYIDDNDELNDLVEGWMEDDFDDDDADLLDLFLEGVID
ncbi:MAG: hypothetical protein PF505_11045, partial [Vallitaleaceae bacterium]|nr:hypothetical protein [Vallitaleaceae bacterium]